MNENELNPQQDVQEAPVSEVPEACPAEAPETVTPAAEEPKKTEEPRKAWDPVKIALAVVAVVAVIALVATWVIHGREDGGSNQELTNATGTQDSTGETTGETVEPGTVPPDGNHDDATCKGTYTVTDEQVVADADKVIATLGDQQMTNADLQIYYWMQVVSFLNEYGSYASYIGLDYTQPLDTQVMDETGTWQQYFLQCGLDAWCAYEALAQEAIAAGFDKESEDYQTYIASVRDEVKASAESYGYESLEEMLTSIVGPGSNEEAYIDYMQTYYLGYLYYNALYEQMIPTADEIETYFDSKAETYAEEGISKDEGIYVDVRHILVMPEGGTTDESGATTYSEEEWEAARVEAQLILDNWLAGEATEESFGDLAAEHTDDSNGADGGLYTYVYEGQMVTEFNDWCFDPARQVGDYGLVKTTYGYHVMYFSGSNPIWYVTAQADLENEIANSIVPDAMEKYEATFDYPSMVLGYVDLTQ